MAADIVSGLNKSELKEFRNDFKELMRVHFGVNKEYSKLSKDVDRYISEFRQIVDLFNKKYRGLSLKLNQTAEELQLRIFIKEKSVKDVFVNVASRLDGLKAIGTKDSGKVELEEADKFSKEIDKIKDKLFIYYFMQETGSSTVLLEQCKEEMIELHHSKGISNEKSPEFRLLGYYAVKGGIGDVDVHERLSAMGFTEMPAFDKERNFFKKFNPRIEE